MRALVARFLRALRTRRRLRATTSGQLLIVMTLAVGFAAFNTGNNLLFFGWGLLLSAIVVSGILSESTLRSVRLRFVGHGELRATRPGMLSAVVANTRRLPAFAIDTRALIDDPRAVAGASLRAYELLVRPHSQGALELPFTPARRGRHRVHELVARTAFPFGLFEKEKHVLIEPPIDVVVWPAPVAVGERVGALLARIGESPARKQGRGDELFSLRPHRVGDDPRRIAWRRSARSGRLVVKETEAEENRDVILDVRLHGANEAAQEHALSFAGSFAEALLDAGHAVGVRAPGTALACAHGPRQRAAVLEALALVDASAAEMPRPGRRVVVVAIVATGASAPTDADAVLRTDDVAPPAVGGGA